ncbi:MAG: hypothetical protein WBA17_11995 [Saprospiraceae bacterium]
MQISLKPTNWQLANQHRHRIAIASCQRSKELALRTAEQKSKTRQAKNFKGIELALFRPHDPAEIKGAAFDL